MAKRRKVANPLALAVLAELTAEPMHPYEMGRRLKEHGKDRDIKYTRSSLYMVVEQLRKAGFVAERETVRDTQRPERTVYALTEDGRHELHDWMRQLVAEPQHEYPHFGVALSLLSVLPPVEAAELLGRRLETLDGQVEEVHGLLRTAKEQDVPWIFLIEEEYRLGRLETEQRFVTHLIESLKEPDHIRAWQEFFGSRT
ncbi:PadR family transcriptional regulator [Streptomyces beihaiensis]|uniref:PadR family transcriptional regulator n=1 Tax=Streptomyces beihaiensis TaxID=2984495 RepID=A0ABT3TZR0_9ACTN|nr:PadR family transcriptional regulator [Streptomyces beihaiensis]MCX3061540.1 PadR family transcriptional regulator [Streptomyces beihaiensis]